MLCDFDIDPEHPTLIDRNSNLSDQGSTMKAIAETLNGEGCKPHSGKPFYSELVGVWVSKYRRKARERFSRKVVTLTNEDGGLDWRFECVSS
jgi:hypothetical protein